MKLCDSDALDLTNPCVRGSWAALAPTVLVLLICLSFVPPPLPKVVLDAIKSPFAQYLSLHEAEGLVLADEKNSTEAELEVENTVPLWRTVVFVFIGLLECLAWLANGTFLLITGHPRWDAIQQLLVALTWVYTAVRPILRPTATPPYDMLTLYLLHIAGDILQLGGYMFQHNASGVPLPGTLVLVGLSVDLALLVGLVAVIMGMPVALPSHLVKKEDIGSSVSPEDYTVLWRWVTFTWVYPLVKRGRNATLNEKDIWNLSPNIQSRPIFIKFSTLPQKSLLVKIWAANSFDIIVDFILTLCSILFNYAEPFFLKRILDSLDTSDDIAKNKGKAYIYAILMFTCSLCKAQCDVQHLWLGRRACTRIRSELMAAVYDKALKRRDFSGVVDQEKAKEAADKKAAAAAGTPPVLSKAEQKAKDTADKESAEKADDPKAGAADTGKIVNLMAGDANRISFQVGCELHALPDSRPNQMHD
ncbi:hypothetical protein MVEN_00791700 [Mycena venus]|uniref:ABC transmembrane type-1 domain-containing protein n=1 Tax=Mycena venus TaxID=2733690 RepID=A0A8H6YK98_9AGAR|nr:hypothetical protein MVEN_00791700 [Mycena venus]